MLLLNFIGIEIFSQSMKYCQNKKLCLICTHVLEIEVCLVCLCFRRTITLDWSDHLLSYVRHAFPMSITSFMFGYHTLYLDNSTLSKQIEKLTRRNIVYKFFPACNIFALRRYNINIIKRSFHIPQSVVSKTHKPHEF